MNLRIKVVLISICVILVCQILYSQKNVRSFEQSYLETLHAKSVKIGQSLKNDIEAVLGLNIPIDKLIRLETTLKKLLSAAPELDYIEITDDQGSVLYYADHDRMKKYQAGERLSDIFKAKAQVKQDEGPSKNLTDTSLPLYNIKKRLRVGYINLHLSMSPVKAKLHDVVLDIITVIIVSILMTFEFLSLFVTVSITSPVEAVVKQVNRATENFSPLPGKVYLLMNELNYLINRLNEFMTRYLKYLYAYRFIQSWYPRVNDTITCTLAEQAGHIDDILNPVRPDQAPLPPAVKTGLGQLQAKVTGIKTQLNGFAATIADSSFLSGSTGKDATEPRSASLYPYVRPLIFYFIMAQSFSISFLPMLVDSLYEPFPGLSREMVLGLPISIFMFFFAVSMPLAGIFCDSKGWLKPIIIGIILDIAGLILTGLAQDIYQLIMFRSLTGIGFGIVLVASQQFVYENTTSYNRAAGMAAYVAAYFSGDICGTVIGGMLASRIGYANVFFVSAVFSAFALIYLLAIAKKEALTIQGDQGKGPFKGEDFIAVLKDKEFVTLTFLQAIPAKLVLIGVLFYYVPLYLTSIGVGQSTIGRVIMAYGLMLILMGPVISKYLNKIAFRKYNILIGGMLTGISMVIFYFYTGFIPMLVIVVMIGLAHAFSVSAQATLVTELEVVKKMGVGSGMGLFRFWERVGNILGPMLMGVLITTTGYETALVVMGLISLACTVIYILCHKKSL